MPGRKEAGRQGQDSSRDSETEIRSSSLQGTDKPGASSSVGSSGERLHQKDQRSEILCTTEQDFPSKCEELGRGLHLVSEQHLRAGRRAPRGLKVCGGGQRRVPRLWPQVSTASNDQSTSGLDKDRSSEDQTTSALGVGRRHCNEDAGTNAAPCGLGGVDHVFGLPEAGRMPGDPEDRPGKTYAKTGAPHAPPAPCRETRGLKSWDLGRVDSAGFSAAPLVGSSVGTASDGRAISFRAGTRRDGLSLETSLGGSRTGTQPRSPAPTIRHSGPSYDRCHRLRSLLEIKARGRWAADSSLRRYEQHGRLNQEFHRLPQATQKLVMKLEEQMRKLSPRFFTHPDKTVANEKIVIELFSGCARLSPAMVALAFTAIAYDIDYGHGCDLLDRGVQRELVRFIKRHRNKIALIWLGTPCTSWSRARRFDGGPRPLRDDDVHLWVFSDLRPSDQSKVLLGNQLLEVSKFFIDLACHLNLAWVLENPFSSRLWLTPQARALIDFGARLHETHFCCFGTPWRKATGLLEWNFPTLALCIKQCSTKQGRCQFTGERHLTLSGQDSCGRWLTHIAQPYPRLLCQLIAEQLHQVHK